jgi:hypothetical protein
MPKVHSVNKFIKYVGIALSIKLLYDLYLNNLNKSVKEAKENEYSNDNIYNNISPLKHDIFKQITLDITPIIFTNLFFNTNKQIKFIEYDNIDNFTDSIVGKVVFSTTCFILYYHLIQPYIVNKI